MLDTIMYVSSNEIHMIFEDRVVVIHSDKGNALDLLAIILSPFPLREGNEYKEYMRLTAISEEDTAVIELDKVA